MAAVTNYVPNFMGTGRSLYLLPTSPGYRTMEWHNADGTLDSTSPYTGIAQTMRWLGSDNWACTVSLPTLNMAQAAQWRAALLAMRGGGDAFQLCDQLYTGPQNPSALEGATVVTDASQFNNLAGTTVLGFRGFTPSTYGVLSAGDYCQIGYRYYMILTRCDSDAQGRTATQVWPSLRENHGDGLPVDVTAPVGIFRRADNVLSWTTNYDKTTSLSFRVMECR